MAGGLDKGAKQQMVTGNTRGLCSGVSDAGGTGREMGEGEQT
jgi:hypothetical protein